MKNEKKTRENVNIMLNFVVFLIIFQKY